MELEIKKFEKYFCNGAWGSTECKHGVKHSLKKGNNKGIRADRYKKRQRRRKKIGRPDYRRYKSRKTKRHVEKTLKSLF